MSKQTSLALSVPDPIERIPEPYYYWLYLLGKLALIDEDAERHWEKLPQDPPPPPVLNFFCTCGAGFAKSRGLKMHRRLSSQFVCNALER